MPEDSEAVRLLTEMKESLEREMITLRQHMDGGFKLLGDKFDAQAARLNRHGGLLRSGQINLVRLNSWSEEIDMLLASRDQRIDALEARIKDLEKPR